MADIRQVQHAVAQSDEVADIPIVQENGEPYVGADGSPSTIGVVGEDSKHFKREFAAFSKQVARKSKADQEKVDWRRGAAKCGITRWGGWEDGGTAFPFTAENADLLLAPTHILEQVEAGIKGTRQFFRETLLELLAYVRFETDLDSKAKGERATGTNRDHLERLAAKGHRTAVDALTNPNDYPQSLRYLHEWAIEVLGGSGDGVTWQTVDAWSRHTGREPSGEEVLALFDLCAALMPKANG